MDIGEIEIFVRVLQTGSFSKAAKALGISKSTVSTKISQLESRLGVPLVQRTTRKLGATHTGRAYYQECARALNILTDAEAHLSQDLLEAKGLLRITVPSGLADSLLGKILQSYSREAPHVDIEVVITDRFVDLVGEGIDLAIRAGELKDSSYIARKIGLADFGLFASPKYIKKHGEPTHPEQLKEHLCLKTVFPSDANILQRGKESVKFPASGKIRVNSLPALKRLALLDMGIAVLGNLGCAEEVASGRLLRLLPEWKMHRHSLYFVYPAHNFVSRKLEIFMKAASEVMKPHLMP